MFFELRQYQIFPGKMAEWVKFVEEFAFPFQVAKGMVIIGSFVGQEDPNLFVWIRRFESEEQRVAVYKAVYEDAEWQAQASPKIREMLDRPRMVVTRIEPTPKSAIQ